MIRRFAALALLTALLTSTYVAVAQIDSQSLMSKAMDLLRRVQELSVKGVNVTQYAHALNTSLALIQDGRLSEAEALLKSLDYEVSKAEAGADTRYVLLTLAKYFRVGVTLLIPLAFYVFFPRLYAYLWFKVRRRWVVRGST